LIIAGQKPPQGSILLTPCRLRPTQGDGNPSQRGQSGWVYALGRGFGSSGAGETKKIVDCQDRLIAKRGQAPGNSESLDETEVISRETQNATIGFQGDDFKIFLSQVALEHDF
jgi:hypothetical protein